MAKKLRLLKVVLGVGVLVVTVAGNLFAKDGLLSRSRQFDSGFSVRRSEGLASFTLAVQDGKHLLRLELAPHTPSPGGFSAHLDNGETLDVVVDWDGNSWWVELLGKNGGPTKTKFDWPSGVRVILSDGSDRVPEIRSWWLYGDNHPMDSSYEQQRRSDAFRIALGATGVGLLLGIGLLVIGAVDDKDEVPRTFEVYDMVEIMVIATLAAEKPGRRLGDGDAALVRKASTVLRGVLLHGRTATEMLDAHGVGVRRATVEAAYIQFRFRFLKELRRLQGSIEEFKQTLEAAKDRLAST